MNTKQRKSLKGYAESLDEKQFCNVKLGDGKVIFNEIQVINARSMA